MAYIIYICSRAYQVDVPRPRHKTSQPIRHVIGLGQRGHVQNTITELAPQGYWLETICDGEVLEKPGEDFERVLLSNT